MNLGERDFLSSQAPMISRFHLNPRHLTAMLNSVGETNFLFVWTV